MNTTNIDMDTTMDIERIEMPEGVFGFGLAEVAYLLGRWQTDSAGEVAELLALDALLESPDFLTAGASSLVARGLLTKRGTDAVPVAEASLLEYALAASERWFVMTLGNENAIDLALVGSAPNLTSILQPRAAGSWFASYADPQDASAEKVIVGLARTFATQHPGGVVGVSGPGDVTFGIKAAGDDQYEIVDSSQAATPQPYDRRSAIARVAEIIGK